MEAEFVILPQISMLFFFSLFVLVCMYMYSGWEIYAKAGQPGWAFLIPVYSAVVYLRILKRPWWYLLLFLIPGINLLVWMVLRFELGRVFGKGILFSLFWLIVFPIFGWVWLGFGDDAYSG